MEMKNREAEFNTTIMELREESGSLQEKVAKEESEKIVRFLFIDLLVMYSYFYFL